MRSLLMEVDFETLHARYAELLRLREYVERLEERHNAEPNSDETAHDALEQQPPDGPSVVGIFG